ncbi:hypothetical protein CBR_g19690 [Chara braunii]|uniref:Uncharacterized protein n=1 Tax=Chara braunii TaxID=69332 RepID=A0A388KYN5_CHABU|nr:hypothetical protein CBR_g19690 [Chara braunii]|eukprot:GBG75177.1 hypothetical protein CBR_g19690 [Chara braunii]
MLGRADCSECMWVHFLRVFQGMATHGRSRSAGGSAPHGEERRGTTSSPARETSRGGGSGEEERRAQNLWCDYSKCVWYLDWASLDGSNPLQPPCGPLLFVAVRADRTRLAGSIVQWVGIVEYNFKFTLKKHYRIDGSVDDIAKGCNVTGRMFGGYGRRAMSLSYFVPLAPRHDEAVHVTDFLEVWARSGTSASVVDVGPGTSISGPVGFPGGECSERGMGGQGGLQATPPDQEVGMSDDSEDDYPRAPSKPGLHGSRRQGLLGESTPRGGGDGERLRQGSESMTPRGLVERIGLFVHGMQVAGVSPGDRAGGPQTELSLEREASGNVAGEKEVSEQGLFRERSAKKAQSGGKRNLPDEEEREGVGALKRHRKVGGSARTPTSREGGSVEKRKRVGGGDETPKDSSTQRRTGESSGKRSKSSRGKKADEGGSGEGNDDVDIHLKAFNLDNAFFLEMQTGVQKDVVLHIHPERILGIPDWEDAYNHKSLDEFLVDTIASAMIDCYERKDMRYTKPIFVLASIVAPPENGEPAVRVLPADFHSSQQEKYEYYPVCGQHNARAAMKVVWSLLQQGRHVLVVDGDTTQLEYTVQYVTHEVSSKAYPCDFHHVVVKSVYDPNKDMFFKLTPKKRCQVYSFLYDEQPRLRFDPQYVVRKEVAIAVLQGYHGASQAGEVSFIKRLEYVFFNENVLNPTDFTLDNYKLAFGEEDDFNIETKQEESVEDELFDLDGQLSIFNAQVSESPSVCKPGTPLATPTSGSPTPVSSSSPVKRGGLSRLRSSPGEPIPLTRSPNVFDPAIQFLRTIRISRLLRLPSTWATNTPSPEPKIGTMISCGTQTISSQSFSTANGQWLDTLFDLLQSNRLLEVSSAFYALPSSPSIKQVSWELPAGTPPAGVVKRKSRGKDGKGDGQGGGQRGTGGGSEQRSTKQRSPGHAGGGEGKKGSREKKKPRSGEKTKHHTGDEQGSDVDRDEDGGVLAVTGSTSMETGNDFRPGWITRPGEQDLVISSTSATQYTDAVGGAVVAKNGTCFAQLQKRLADCLRSIRASETTSSSGTQCLPGSETTTYHGSGSDKLQPCSVSPQKEVRINPNPEASTVERAQRSAELKRVVRVSENPGGEIRIHPNQEDVSAMTDDRCQYTVMLCMEVHKKLQADCPTEVLSNSPVKADTSLPLETAVARMNPNQGLVSMSLTGAALETTVIRIHPRHMDEGLDGCRLLTNLDKDDSADDWIDPTLGDVGMEQPVQPVYDDPLYSGLDDEAMGEDVLKKSSDAVGDRFLYLSDDFKDTAHEDNKLRGGEVSLDIRDLEHNTMRHGGDGGNPTFRSCGRRRSLSGDGQTKIARRGRGGYPPSGWG